MCQVKKTFYDKINDFFTGLSTKFIDSVERNRPSVLYARWVWSFEYEIRPAIIAYIRSVILWVREDPRVIDYHPSVLWQRFYTYMSTVIMPVVNRWYVEWFLVYVAFSIIKHNIAYYHFYIHRTHLQAVEKSLIDIIIHVNPIMRDHGYEFDVPVSEYLNAESQDVSTIFVSILIYFCLIFTIYMYIRIFYWSRGKARRALKAEEAKAAEAKAAEAKAAEAKAAEAKAVEAVEAVEVAVTESKLSDIIDSGDVLVNASPDVKPLEDLVAKSEIIPTTQSVVTSSTAQDDYLAALVAEIESTERSSNRKRRTELITVQNNTKNSKRFGPGSRNTTKKIVITEPIKTSSLSLKDLEAANLYISQISGISTNPVLSISVEPVGVQGNFAVQVRFRVTQYLKKLDPSLLILVDW
jgi:hypothetical protein